MKSAKLLMKVSNDIFILEERLRDDTESTCICVFGGMSAFPRSRYAVVLVLFFGPSPRHVMRLCGFLCCAQQSQGRLG